MLQDIIASAIADGAPVEASMLTAAIRVMAALEAIGPKMRDAMATEPYFPVEYPKWVDGVLVMVTPDVVVADPPRRHRLHRRLHNRPRSLMPPRISHRQRRPNRWQR